MEWNKLSHRIIQGLPLRENEAFDLAKEPESSLFDMMSAADTLRRHFKGNKIHTCSFLNGKSGACSENCAYCSQSSFATTDSPVYSLVDSDVITKNFNLAEKNGISNFSTVTSGRNLSSENLESFIASYKLLRPKNTKLCASLGILSKENLLKLKQCGISKIHHNLETSRSFFPCICTSHTYEDRLNTIKNAIELDFDVCSGGLFGLGETDSDVVELALELRSLHINSIPVNFLIPVKGTTFEKKEPVSARRALKIIALMRLINPRAEIIMGCGREKLLGELHPLVFFAGASGIMVGDFLTKKGRNRTEDKLMLDSLGLENTLI